MEIIENIEFNVATFTNDGLVTMITTEPTLKTLKVESCLSLVYQINTGLEKYVSFLTSLRKLYMTGKLVGSYLLRIEIGGGGGFMMTPI